MPEAEWSEQRFHEIRGPLDERLHQPAIASRVARPEVVAGFGDRTPDDDGGPVVERVCEWCAGVHELEAVLGEGQRRHEWRRQREGMDRRADVVHIAGLGELRGAHAAADGRRGFVDSDRAAGAREGDRGSKAVRSRSDDDRVKRHAVRCRSLHSRAIRTIVRDCGNICAESARETPIYPGCYSGASLELATVIGDVANGMTAARTVASESRRVSVWRGKASSLGWSPLSYREQARMKREQLPRMNDGECFDHQYHIPQWKSAKVFLVSFALCSRSFAPVRDKSGSSSDNSYVGVRASTRRGLPLPFTILSGAAITTAPVGGS